MSPARVLSFLALIGAAACSSDDEGTDEICSTEHVIDKSAHRKDLIRAWQIGIACGLIGLAVAVVAVLLPV